MADIKISQLTALLTAVDSDLLIINDTSAGTTKSISIANLFQNVPVNLVDSASGSKATSDLTVNNELTVGGEANLTTIRFTGSLVDTIAGINSPGLVNAITSPDATIPTSQAVIDYFDSARSYSRAGLTGTATALADADSADLNITGYKTYALLKIQTSHASRVTLYANEEDRDTDRYRAIGTPFTDSSGCIVDIATQGADTILMSPGKIGYNSYNPALDLIYARVQNNSGGANDIAVTLTAVQLED